MSSEELEKVIAIAEMNLKDAKAYLNNIRKWYAETPDMLKYFEPSAIQRVDELDENLRELRKRKSATEDDGA